MVCIPAGHESIKGSHEYIIGLIDKGRTEYWKLIFWTLFTRPELIVDAITFSIYGYHFRKVFGVK